MPTLRFLSRLLLLLVCAVSLAQQQSNQKQEIATKINDYFFLERENIHVHFDKSIFLSNENIWFKGYVYHRKQSLPFTSSINIFASLIEDHGNILETKLFYSDTGSFEGNFPLGDKFKSGKYYLQFYTNWMNNFSEDESSVYEITIINEGTEVPAELISSNFEEMDITLHPEGNRLILDTNNTVGICVRNCGNGPTKATEAEVIDSKGQIIKTIPLNKAGYGKFDLKPEAGQTYKVVVSLNGFKHEATVMPAQSTGVIIEANTYTLTNKTFLRIGTNNASIASYLDKPLYIVVHKDEKIAIFELNFNDKNLEQTITLDNAMLFEGLNTIRIIDSNLNQLAERLIYIYPQTELNNTELNKLVDKNGQIEISGMINSPNANLSITVLPSESISLKENNDMLGNLLVSPYLLNQEKISLRAYLNSITRSSKYEMDLYLLNQQSKYKWESIRSNPPKDTYSFDTGLELKGTINQPIKSPEKYKIQLQSLENMLDETVAINKKNEFVVKNLILRDSAKINFKLIGPEGKSMSLKLYPQVFNNIRKFNKPFIPKVTECPPVVVSNIKLPEFPIVTANSIMLKDIEIESTRLKYRTKSGNVSLHGYKITEDMLKWRYDAVDLIKQFGFFTRYERGGFLVIYRYSQGRNIWPLVYVNDILISWYDDLLKIRRYDDLLSIPSEDIDEIYIGSNFNTIIKIYTNKKSAGKKILHPGVDFIVKNGFEREKEFENVDYSVTNDNEGFENFGIIDWQPTVITDEKGNFKINVPNKYSGEVKIMIEGFNQEGKLISEVKTLTL